MRAQIAEEQKAAMVGASSPAAPVAGLQLHGGMSKAQREAALMDPRVQAELAKALNGPNKVAYDQNLTRNTTRVSAERRW